MEIAGRVIEVREIRRFFRFAVIGVIGTLVDFTVLVILKDWVGLTTVLANTLSFSAGTLNNFTLNRLWTFADSRSKSPLLQLGQFALVSLIGWALNTGIVLATEHTFSTLPGFATHGYLLAKMLATGIVLFWNFTANRLWTFGDVS